MTSTGATLEVSASLPATEDETGYDALTYTKIGGITNLGAFGASAAVVESNQLDNIITGKYKGQLNQGSMSIDSEYDPEDAGQAIMFTAVEDVTTGGAAFDRHSFKLTYQTGDVRYFGGKVFTATENVGGVNAMVAGSLNVEIETVIVRVAAP